MDMNAIAAYIRPELLILVPVLYFIGMGMKHSEAISDKQIPALLGLCGIFTAALYLVATSPLGSVQDAFMAVFAAITQGVLAAGCSVYVDQIIKQSGKEE